MSTKKPYIEQGMIITPALAKQWLEENSPDWQRHASIEDVKRLARDILAGRWSEDTSMIAFDVDNFLINGQHRLKALVLAGEENPNVRMKVDVKYNMPRESRHVIDTGRSRSTKDVLKFSGFDTDQRHTTTLPPFVLHGANGMMKETRLTVRELGEIYKEHKEAIDFAAELAPTERQQVRAVLARASYHVEPEVLKRFAHIVRTGTDEDGIVKPEDNSAIKLRNFLGKLRKGVRTTKQGKEIYRTAEWALKQFVDRKSIKNLSTPREDDFNEYFPLPKELFPLDSTTETVERSNNKATHASV